MPRMLKVKYFDDNGDEQAIFIHPSSVMLVSSRSTPEGQKATIVLRDAFITSSGSVRQIAVNHSVAEVLSQIED